MEQCPKCGRYMSFHMAYSCGNPVIYWVCKCGYDTRNQTTYATSIVGDLDICQILNGTEIKKQVNIVL